MTFPAEFVSYLVQFHGSPDYFECHEILEEYWKEVDPRNKKSHWVGFILLAVSAYHHRRENFIGAEKSMKKAITIMENITPEIITSLGLSYAQLLTCMNACLLNIQNGKSYESFNLPINNDQLLQLCRIECNSKGLPWSKQHIIDDRIIHRHMLRDRSEVIKEREYQKELRKENSHFK